MVTPDDKRINVLSKGIWVGLKGDTPCGGQFNPSSIFGARLEWKKAQKNEMKKNTSDVMNKIIPHRIPLETLKEWCPWKVLSRIISRHHWIIVKINVINPIVIRIVLELWNHSIIPNVMNNAANAPVRGQGLILTKW